MSVTNHDVLHAAQLARLSIDDARLPDLVAELNGILGHIDALQRATIPADVGEGDPAGMPLRPDDVLSVTLQRPREAFGPDTRDGFFLVPRLATHGDAGASASSTMAEGHA